MGIGTQVCLDGGFSEGGDAGTVIDPYYDM